MTQFRDGLARAAAIKAGELSAMEVLETTLAQIQAVNPQLNCFTHLTVERAQAQAARVDAALAGGQDPGPLAGVPFAVKNLFDIEGVVTLAGSQLNQTNAPARQDATVIARLQQAGAVLVGALNMDEYAYGFVTINAHFGTTPNPHDPQRLAGGSSGGSAAAVAAGLVPLTLGSDTNGSIRVPAALCGVYGLKPTYGRLSRAGAYLFCASLDHVGPLGQSLRDVALAYDLMQGGDPRDPVCTTRPPETVSQAGDEDLSGLRLARLSGHFDRGMEPAVRAVLDQVVAALGITTTEAMRRV
ncbi:MAG TPA: AtzE family amidohydrolase, partial [Leptolyngbyaceae cyanobacterium M65_K2018_010]|nr:AtzE family amidohydrolase [Leptolyngbyaceae cyanobacterium M65_K2018_010]